MSAVYKCSRRREVYLAFYLMCFTTLNLLATRYISQHCPTRVANMVSSLKKGVCVYYLTFTDGLLFPTAGSCWFSHINAATRGFQLGFAYAAPDVFILIGRRFPSLVYFAARHSPSIPCWNQCLI